MTERNLVARVVYPWAADPVPPGARGVSIIDPIGPGPVLVERHPLPHFDRRPRTADVLARYGWDPQGDPVERAPGYELISVRPSEGR